jgi:hypothetical protein
MQHIGLIINSLLYQHRIFFSKEITSVKLMKPTGYVMYQQFNIQQLPTLYLYVLYLSENKQRLVPLTA